MNKNVGSTDRTIRIIIGILLIIAGVARFNWFLVIIGLLPLITGLINYCPLYSLLGISTCKVKTEK